MTGEMYSTRPAVEADIPAVTEIVNAMIGSTTYEWTELLHTPDERMRWWHEKRSAGFPVLVAVEDDAVVGVASYGDFRDSSRWPGYRFTVEHSVHVAGTHWSRGIGRGLMSALVDCARRDGKRVMVAGIDASNVRSIGFHARLGFEEVARMPGVGDKWGQRLTLVLMQCELAHVDW
jgi:phosphinothricin acetyltransferase